MFEGLVDVFAGYDTAQAVTAFIAGAAILAIAGFAAWISKEVGRFFDGVDDRHRQDEIDGRWS